jgi:hypothetical protein
MLDNAALKDLVKKILTPAAKREAVARFGVPAPGECQGVTAQRA